MRLVAAAFVCLVVCAPLHAQRPDYEEHPAADPSRPTVTNPAHIPPPGYLQFEQGINQAFHSPGLEHQFSVVQATKIALNHRLMTQVISQPVALTRLGPGDSSRDTGDLVLGTQVLFTDEEEGHSKVPTLALAFNRRLRTGTSPDLDIGSFAQGLTLLASGDLHGIHYDTNALFNEQESSDASGRITRRAQFGQSLSLSRNITPSFSLTGELWHFTQPFAPGNAVGILFAGGLTVRPTLVLDAGFDRGLTSTSTDWQVFTGFTYLLPHRLWHKHGQ